MEEFAGYLFIIGGICMFFWGMKYFSSGVGSIVGSKGIFTKNGRSGTPAPTVFNRKNGRSKPLPYNQIKIIYVVDPLFLCLVFLAVKKQLCAAGVTVV